MSITVNRFLEHAIKPTIPETLEQLTSFHREVEVLSTSLLEIIKPSSIDILRTLSEGMIALTEVTSINFNLLIASSLHQATEITAASLSQFVATIQTSIPNFDAEIQTMLSVYFKQCQLPFVIKCDLNQHEVLEHLETELLPTAHERIVIYSPSVLLLEKLRAQHISIHDLTWRQFEEVVAELLMCDGYAVELGRGTKDDGVDIIAVKEIRGVGLIMSVWQAKKLNIGNKVGVSMVRELADTRNKLNASKGVIVTTTSLTQGALKRVEQDCYLLHKRDGNDLNIWIQEGRQP